MGNICSCGRADEDANDPFARPGRTLGEERPKPTTASAPPAAASSQGRKLGGGAGGSQGQTDPQIRSAAAKAAEERAKKAQGSGQLGKKLDAQKRQTQTDTLASASHAERAARTQDASAANMAYN